MKTKFFRYCITMLIFRSCLQISISKYYPFLYVRLQFGSRLAGDNAEYQATSFYNSLVSYKKSLVSTLEKQIYILHRYNTVNTANGFH